MPRKTIIRKSFYAHRKEAVAAGTITPGDHVDLAAGGLDRAGADIKSARTFAVENDLVGGSISDDYSTGDTVQYMSFLPGDEILAKLAANETVVVGTRLKADSAGALVEAGSDEEALVVAVARQASDTDSAVLIEVEVV